MNLDLRTILESIKKWDSIRNNETELYRYLTQGNYFPFECIDKGTSAYLHAYPGILDDKLVYFIIPSEYDSPVQTLETVSSHVTVWPVKLSLGGSHEISKKEAQKRIDNWHLHLAEWIPQQISTAVGMFNAFSIPSVYLKNSKKYTAFFALKNSLIKADSYTADLVIVDVVDQANVYYDTVRPVPPFPPISEETFYLFDLAEEV